MIQVGTSKQVLFFSIMAIDYIGKLDWYYEFLFYIIESGISINYIPR